MLRFKPTYAEVAMEVVIPGEEGEREPSVEGVCTHVRYCIETAIREVTSDLHYMEHCAEHELAIYCNHEKARLECHPAKIKYNHKKEPKIFLCEACYKLPLTLPNGYKHWFSKIEPPEIPRPQGGLSTNTAQASGTPTPVSNTPIPVGGYTTGGVTFNFTGGNVVGGTATGGGATGGVEGSATGGNAIGGSAKGAGGGVHVTVLTGGGQQEVMAQFASH